MIAAMILLTAGNGLRADVVYNIALDPGTPAEAGALVSGAGSMVDGNARRAEKGGAWTYRIVVPPQARCILSFACEGAPVVRVFGLDGKPLPSRVEKAADRRKVYASAPAHHPPGGALRFQIRALYGPVAVRSVRLMVQEPDRNKDGVGDFVERLMGVPPGQRPAVVPRPPRPQTSFQTGDRFYPAIGVPTDAVLVYSSDPAVYQTWAEQGYTLQTMGGFRDGPEYVKQHPGEAQTDRDGNPLVIGGSSYYMLPTVARNEIAKQYYEAAVGAGSTAICPEEPEIFARAGYSDAFKQEWQARYGAPWEPPHGSVDARYKAEQLKSFLTRRQIETILEDAQRVKPSVTRMVAVHSPVTYYHWGITVPHYALLTIPALQEIIGQVWTGTARTAARAGGIRAERTFEVGYLEYSSLYNLARGSGKRIWFLMDPVEDTPNLPIEDYHRNYEQTLLAALMFPDVDSYEVMPWPQRIYEHVPAFYATLVNTIVGALCEMWRYPNGAVDAGSAGIGTFFADSMGWQRADPSPSDYDGFYGLSLPLIMHGIPVQVLSLDRITEPGYLNRAKVLLVSYDFLKPAAPEINRALADWTRRGGCLIVFGGTDAYNAVADSWWRRAGRNSPLEDLFAQLGIPVRNVTPPYPPLAKGGVGGGESSNTYKTLLTGDGAEHNLRNRRLYTMDLTTFAQENGSVSVRFEDVTKQDGWGPYVVSAELRIGGRLTASFRAGSELESRFLAEDRDSRISGNSEARFADMNAYWVYRFDNLPKKTPITLTVDMGNGFLVKAGPSPPPGPLLETTDTTIGRMLARLRVPSQYSLTLYAPPSGATELYHVTGETAPVVWEAPAGKGAVLYAGIAPGYLTANAQSARWLRALVRRAMGKIGGTYEEQTYFRVKRGPYTAICTLGKSYQAEGRFVDLLKSNLPVVEDPEIPARSWAFLADAGPEKGAARVLAVSGRLRARNELFQTTAFLSQAPAKTEGTARIGRGKRTFRGAKAFTIFGAPLPVTAEVNEDSVLLRYPNDPDGVVVRVGWD
jgi:hypothetical protein